MLFKIFSCFTQRRIARGEILFSDVCTYARTFVLCFLLFFSQYSFTQDTIDNTIEQKLESLAETTQNEDDDYSNLLEALSHFKKHPIDLNKTNTAELSELGLLDGIQIGNLFAHIEKNGKLLSIYELQSIDGFDLQTIEKIRPYITVGDATGQLHASFKTILRHGEHEILLRGQQVMEDQVGYSPIDSADLHNSPNARFIGSPQKIYARYRFTYGNNLSAGITAEKDAGELFFKKNNLYQSPHYDSLLNGNQKNGFDFYSAHLFLKNIGKLKALALGDFQVGFGQGLTAWSGLAYGKSYDAMNIRKFASGIRPYTSTDENRFMRGVALTGGIKNMEVTGFLSRKKADANITLTDSINTSEVLEVSSLQESGLHTTAAEISDKDAITQTVIGGNVSYVKKKYSIGLTGTHTSLDAILKRSTEPYNQFEFSGKQITNLGADYSVVVRNINLFGEISSSGSSSEHFSQPIGWGTLNGCIISLDPKVSISILHRSFQKTYQSLFANAYAESSSPANEQGLYFGILVKPAQSITINAYYDRYYFPWLKYRVDAPSGGTEYLLQANYNPTKKFEAYVRIRQKDKFINSGTIDDIDFIVPYKQTNYRLHLGYQVSPSVKLRNRVELLCIDNTSSGKENGYLIYQDILWKPLFSESWISKISFTLRYALFDTKSYASRIYAFETDIPGSYSIPSYYYKGSRTYLMLNYNIIRNLQLWVRWSQTYYANKSVNSQGSLNEINGRSKSEVKVELKLKF